MLFNSYIFLFAFLPATIVGYFYFNRRGENERAFFFLVVASLFFYAWWNAVYLVLILFSIGVNFYLGTSIAKSSDNRKKKLFAITGVVLNLGLLGYFKYANFFIDNINYLLGLDIHLGKIFLPLAISFFTFQQITYIVDSYKGLTKEYSFLHYCLFVTFFPQLIAGPIVHHSEMLPQFTDKARSKFRADDFAIGISMFFIGLFKKVVLADGIAAYSTPVFNAADSGAQLSFLEAWGGALAYTFQLYFDFSGYSDMAIGIARIFGIKLPLNFLSPYKAVNIIDFWRRWHITLSRFLRDYLYIPLGGNRKGKSRRYVNLLVTMLLGGLWHGAAWTFVFWGMLHGVYLIINHAWIGIKKQLFKRERILPKRIGKPMSVLITFVSVVFAWVFFRAESFDGAVAMIQGMAGLNGFIIPERIAGFLGPVQSALLEFNYISIGNTPYFYGPKQILACVFLFIVIWTLPSTQQFFSRYEPALNFPDTLDETLIERRIKWHPAVIWSVLIGLLYMFAIASLSGLSEFLYFQF
jgi:D-alanyl-lipoteichoic acid acyltransferase DltB (MBOAT superfamily)